MKTFKEYHKKNRNSLIVATIFAVVFAIAYYVVMDSVIGAVGVFCGSSIINFVINIVRSTIDMVSDRAKVKHRIQWESSMLNSIQLASSVYYADNKKALYAFHALAQQRLDEGEKLGYIDLGNWSAE